MSRFVRGQALIALALALALLLLFEATDLDRLVSDRLYDPVAGGFPLRHDWFLEAVMHRGAKIALYITGAGVLAGLGLSFVRPRLAPVRRALLFLVLALGLGPGAVAALKVATDKHCPWDLERYGGSLPYVRLLDAHPDGLPPGRCFPGGHAAGGFAWMSLWFVLRRRQPRLARVALAAGFAIGMALGFGRMIQGAHFLSHNLWAAWVCWVVALLLYALLLDGREPPAGDDKTNPETRCTPSSAAPSPTTTSWSSTTSSRTTSCRTRSTS